MANGPAFLSEYQPQKSVVPAAIRPPGVAKISVCFDLRNSHYQERNT